MDTQPNENIEHHHLDELMKYIYHEAGGPKSLEKVETQNGPPIHDPVGKEDLVDIMVGRGILPRVVAEVTGVPLATIQRWQEKRPHQEREDGIFNFLKEWYSPRPGQVSLEGYCGTFSSIIRQRHAIIDNLLVLREAGILLAYTPRPLDAYLFGVNHGNGCLNSNFTLLFTGTEENLSALERVVPFKPSRNNGIEGSRIYSPALGRLYYLLGLPQGRQSTYSVSVPEWAQSGEYSRSFVTGLLDTTGAYHGGSFYLSKGANVNDRPGLSRYLTSVADILTENGVLLTSNPISITERRFDSSPPTLGGRIWISTSEWNLKQLRDAFTPSSPSFRRILEAKIESYR